MTLTNGGSGYSGTITVGFTGGGGTGAAGTASAFSGTTTLTITSLGDQKVNNYAYSGPSASVAPFDTTTVSRHYGFGAATGKVTIGGQAATVNGWSDTSITVNVPGGVPACGVQQQAQYKGTYAASASS